MPGLGTLDKSKEVRAHPDPAHSVLGSNFRLCTGKSILVTELPAIDHGKDRKNIIVCPAPAVASGVTAGCIIISGEGSSLGSPESQGSPEMRQSGSQTRPHLVSYSDDDSSSLAEFELVESGSESDSGSALCNTTPVGGSPVGRLDDGVGVCYQQPNLSRSMVCERTETTHKSPGTSSDRDSLPSLPGSDPGQDCSVLVGQFYGGSLPEQTGGDEVSVHVKRDSKSAHGVDRPQGDTSSLAHRRRAKRAGGFSLTARAGDRHGMASKRRGFSVDRRRLTLGPAAGRIVRKQQQSPLKSVSLTLSRRAVDRCRRSSGGLAKPGPLRFPASSHPRQSRSETDGGEMQAGASRGPMAPECTLVPEPQRPDNKRSITAASAARHVTAATLGSSSSDSGDDEATPLVGKDSWLRSRGFSTKVSARLEDARGGTTNAIYASKWKLFAVYCKDRSMNPYAADSPGVAEFFTWLFETRKASVRTIRGYRSALGAKLRHSSGFDPGQDEVLSQLMRSFLHERPIKQRTLIKWDVGLVLRYLKTGKLSATANLSPRDLTLKLVFLLALATGKRRSELHALDRVVGKVSDSWDAILLRPRPEFLGKTHFVTGGAGTFSEIVLPSIEKAPGYVLADLSLCPVRTLRIYLRESDKYRSEGQERLIISYMKNKLDDVKKQTISNYLKLLVQQAYSDSAKNQAVCQEYNMKSHDLRGIAASLKASKNATMGEVLASGVWASASTFLTHYVKHFSRDELSNLYSLGPFVAAEAIINA